MEADLLVLRIVDADRFELLAVDNTGSGHAKRGMRLAFTTVLLFTSSASFSYKTGYLTWVVPLRSITGLSVDARERAVK